MKVEIRLDGARSLFDAEVGGEHAGHLHFVRSRGVIAYTRIEVEPEFQGRGVGGSLVRGALDVALAEGVRVPAVCPFMKHWLEHHPDYLGMVRTRGV
ncbi:hypothetical protein GCM10023194_70660 [Planotetraspora phitsanulokensis]|uniref:N-acetyltransferase domain-containing protein n=1 Tax=Planotetraspora phitsanulokensis TaxID=575192 RepID=A0A8J3XKL5_9ACTN|nr:GNAT family N-acetyltransferase [Planotetraspora phitsanulokensis]GII43251.1 hypothetical protein Pph01_82540 [Planotetraspora phitsanulokensis]